MNDRVFSGGNGFALESMEHRACEIMMKSELRNGRGAYEISNTRVEASGPSFGPFQYDLGANLEGRQLLESIASVGKDAHGNLLISSDELESVKAHLYKPFNAFTPADHAIYEQMKPKLDMVLGSDMGASAIDANFVSGIQKKVTVMNAVIDGMTTEPNKTFVQNSDVAKLILIDTKNQYGDAVNGGLQKFVDQTKDDPAMHMPGRPAGTTIKVDGDFGLDDMIRYKLETQYGQNDRNARDVLRRISHCVEAAGVDNVKANLSSEDRTFFETGLEKYLKEHGRNTEILESPELKALAELGGKEQHQMSSSHHVTNDHVQHAGTLREHDRGTEVRHLQKELAQLGLHDAQGHTLVPDSAFGPGTKEAVEEFQRIQNLHPDGIVGTKTLEALKQVTQTQPSSNLTDAAHPGNGMFLQARAGVYRLDAQYGRTPDQGSDNIAGVLTTAAHNNGMTRIDHVLLSEDANRAFAVQGELNSPHKQFTGVDVVQAIGTPVMQSSAQWQHDLQQIAPAAAAPSMQQAQNPQLAQPVMQL